MAELSRQATRQLPCSQPLVSKISKKLPNFRGDHPRHRCHPNISLTPRHTLEDLKRAKAMDVITIALHTPGLCYCFDC